MSHRIIPKHKWNLRRAILSLLLLAILPSIVSAHSVTMNLRFHVADVGDTIRINGTSYSGQALAVSFASLAWPYMSAERIVQNNTLAALAFAGTRLLRATLDTQSDPYLFQLAQDEQQNRFLVVVTNGTWQKVEGKSGRVPAATFGDLPKAAANPGLALQLQLDSVDLTGMLGPGKMLIRSLIPMRLPLVELRVV